MNKIMSKFFPGYKSLAAIFIPYPLSLIPALIRLLASLPSSLSAATIMGLALCFCAGNAGAQDLTAQGAYIMDTAGNNRTSFSNNETVMMLQKVYNSTSTASMIYFTFDIINPDGAVAFRHTGNAAPGTPGLAQSQISGINVAQFYVTPGEYTFKGKAELAGNTPVIQQVRFTVSSPNITLIYPPYGARNLSDKPLTFRWISSGGSRYRIAVGDNAGLHNPVHTYTNDGEAFYSYPDNPTLPREQLTPGAVYYWKIEGLDGANNVISESLVYNFSLKSDTSGQSRNIKTVSLALSSAVSDWAQPVNFKAKVSNDGNTAESNINLKLTLGGIEAQNSPKQITMLSPEQSSEFPFTAFMPEGMNQALAVACVDIFDDNVPDNCKTLLVSKTDPAQSSQKMSYDEMWAAIKARLGLENAAILENYTFASISCPSCSEGELSELIAALLSGESQITSVSSEGGTQTGAITVSSGSSVSLSFGDLSMKQEFFTEISGHTDAFANKDILTSVIRSRKEFKNVWKKLFSGKDLPELDFSKKMLALVVASPDAGAEFVQLLGGRKSAKGRVFDYYFIQGVKGSSFPSPAYLLKAVDAEEGEIEFKRVDMGK